ncbi:hypothetical protein F4556_001435 [Kitasatospora gansuensis]|uniref:Uncharacterized protein n=1 Tax=Kitasatospora gansuensis TaxID=258050 RepID=A0A7W7WGS2_9ACTN|nr:hypothetical protein [Kitasatospora gansuensis]MBB4945900.1 hypothetical protein [Kitasatospora gansuensis]
MANRYWCGECSFKTSWHGESEGLRRQVEHYAAAHPGVAPGGQVETRRRGAGERYGCLRLAAVALVLLAVVAACRH